ncbi:MAG: FAD binding domain-containing protein, partial [Solirubrobacteraceae bacterium]
SVTDTVLVLAEHGADARVLAGGQSLVPMLGMRLVRPSVVVDINGLADELGRIELRGQELVLGALVRYSEVEHSSVVAEHLPLLQQVVSYIGDRQVRNRGTVGGAVAQADPTGEMALACMTLGAGVLVHSTRGERSIAIEDFFLGSYHSALEPDELLTAIVFPYAPARCRFFERGRKHNDFALLSVAAVGSPDDGGAWHDVRIGLGGVSDTPVLAGAAARELEGRHWDDALIARAGELALEAIDPPSDVRASADYRRHLTSVHVRRTLADLAGAADHG